MLYWYPSHAPSKNTESPFNHCKCTVFSLLADVLVLLQIEMMDIPPLSESPDSFLHLTAEKALTPLGQIVKETPGFVPTFSTDEPKVVTRWGRRGGGGGGGGFLQTVKGLKCVIFILNFDYSRHSMVKLIFIPGN